MKLINLILLLLPLTGFSQYDKWIETDSVINGNVKIVGNKVYTWKRPEPKLYKFPIDTLPSGGITTQALDYYNGTLWFKHTTTEVVKGKVETPVNVMDSGMKVEVVETRDTIYKCLYSNFTYFTYDYNVGNTKAPRSEDCTLDKIVTTRRYKLYIINEYGQKEYLSMELSKQK